jgi:hypothetical protein
MVARREVSAMVSKDASTALAAAADMNVGWRRKAANRRVLRRRRPLPDAYAEKRFVA